MAQPTIPMRKPRSYSRFDLGTEIAFISRRSHRPRIICFRSSSGGWSIRLISLLGLAIWLSHRSLPQAVPWCVAWITGARKFGTNWRHSGHPRPQVLHRLVAMTPSDLTVKRGQALLGGTQAEASSLAGTVTSAALDARPVPDLL